LLPSGWDVGVGVLPKGKEILRRSSARFSAESFQRLRILRDIIRKEFERHESAKFDVLTPIPPPPSFSTMR
jgi:hypothetical protein